MLAGDSIATAIHDFVGFQTYAELRGHNFVLNKSFDEVKVEDYDGLYVCGGRAPGYCTNPALCGSIVMESL